MKQVTVLFLLTVNETVAQDCPRQLPPIRFVGNPEIEPLHDPAYESDEGAVLLPLQLESVARARARSTHLRIARSFRRTRRAARRGCFAEHCWSDDMHTS